ncbi:MAG: polysaccharide biosynthesis C-terminal domain-containing protein [Bacteroidales bacterium]|nr:polysaccharide biosynthesis C-terminal domain-containing protein [Bacteroidales bacterium]
MGIIIRQSIKGTIANYVGIAVGFVTTFFVLTNYLTTEEVGLTRVLVDAAVLFSTLAQLGTGSSTVRYYPYFKDDDKNHGLFFWTLIIPFVGFLAFLGIFFACKDLLIRAFEDNSALFVNYFYFVIPIAFFMLYTTVFEVNATILNRVAVPKFIREVVIRSCLLIGYLLFGFNVINLDGLVIVFCATYGIAALLNLLYLLKSGRVSFKPDFAHITKELQRNFLWYTLFMVISALVSSAMPTLSSFFISAQQGLAFAGIYAIANYISAVIEVPYRSLSAITQPHISLAVKENDIPKATRFCQKVALHQLLAGSMIFLIIWINIDLFFQILPNGDQYVMGKWAVFILSVSKLLNSSFGIGGSALGYTNFYYFSLIFTLILMAASITTNLILVPLLGINGGALATLISYFIYYVLLLWFVQKKVGTTPFSWGLLKVVALIALLYIVNEGCHWISSYCLRTSAILPQIAEAVVRTCLVCGIGAYLLYRWKISEEINQMMDKMIAKTRKQ